MIAGAEERICLEVFDSVMHLLNMPLEIDTQPTGINWMTHGGPGVRLFRNHHRSRTNPVSNLIQLFQKGQCFQVLTAAKFVREPLAFLAAIVQIKHRSHGIHTQSVDVKFLEPEERISDKEVSDFVAAIIEDIGAPVRMLPLARIEMFIERRPIKTGESKRIPWKMRRDPIHDHADPALLHIINQVTNIVERTVTGRRSIIITNLVAPGWTIRMFL